MIRSVQRWRNFSVGVERLSTDSLRHCVLWRFMIFIKSSTSLTHWTSWTTVAISALYFAESCLGTVVPISRSDLSEGCTLCWRVDVLVWRLWAECGGEWVSNRGCGCDRCTRAWSVESEYLIWTCTSSIDNEIVRWHNAFAWRPEFRGIGLN